LFKGYQTLESQRNSEQSIEIFEKKLPATRDLKESFDLNDDKNLDKLSLKQRKKYLELLTK
jgi:hypothetical protein